MTVEQLCKEAIIALGYFKPDDVSWLAKSIKTQLPKDSSSNIAARVRKRGRKMNKEQLKAAGLRGNVVFAIEAFERLTPKGKADPLTAYHDTIARIGWNFNRQVKADHLGKTKIYQEVKVFSQTAYNCAAGRALHGKVYRKDQAPGFPLTGCPNAWCNCTWEGVYVPIRHRQRPAP